jgi:DNA-binding NtrC family response regulator
MSTISVLIVDDEEEFASTLAERLALRELKVTVSYSGEDALAMLRKHKVDVVLLDVMMPGIGGLDTLKAILAADADAAVIMLSGHADINTAVQGINQGAYYYLVKPVNIDELVHRIEDAHGGVG